MDKRRYRAKNAYLVEDIADLGSLRKQLDVRPGQQFFVVEAEVRDRRVTGNPMAVTLTDFVRLRSNGVDRASGLGFHLTSSPQENLTLFGIIPIDKNQNQCSLLIGELSHPKVINLNFDSPSIETKQGVFLFDEGYYPEYPY